MTYNADVYCTQGSTHRMCQDYAISNSREPNGQIKGPAYVVVCDGCSGAEHSDFGARLLARAAIRYKDHFIHTGDQLNRILATADVYRQTMGLHIQSLCATLLIAAENQMGTMVTMVGDGGIYARRRDGGASFFEFKYPSGAPYYLRYSISLDDEATYGEKFGWSRTKTIYDLSPQDEVIASRVEDITKIPDVLHPSVEVMPITMQFNRNEYDLIAIMSDGISAFETLTITTTGKHTDLIPSTQVLREVMAFKNTNGEFVQRRCQRAFKQFEENKWKNTDDFSLGVVYMGILEDKVEG